MNPDPDIGTSITCKWMCQNRVMIKIIVISLIVTIFVFILSIYLCLKKNKVNDEIKHDVMYLDD
jgi:hypothetical protein